MTIHHIDVTKLYSFIFFHALRTTVQAKLKVLVSFLLPNWWKCSTYVDQNAAKNVSPLLLQQLILPAEAFVHYKAQTTYRLFIRFRASYGCKWMLSEPTVPCQEKFAQPKVLQPHDVSTLVKSLLSINVIAFLQLPLWQTAHQPRAGEKSVFSNNYNNETD